MQVVKIFSMKTYSLFRGAHYIIDRKGEALFNDCGGGKTFVFLYIKHCHMHKYFGKNYEDKHYIHKSFFISSI